MRKDMVAVVDAVESVVKNVVATQTAAKSIMTVLPAEAVRNNNLVISNEKDPQLVMFQQQLGQQQFDKAIKTSDKKIAPERLEECRNLFIQNCDVLFDNIPDDMTIMEVLDHAINAKLEDAYQLTLRDYKAETAAKITEIIMSQKDPDVIMAMDLLPESVKMLMLKLTAVHGEEVEECMEEAASTLQDEPETIEEVVSEEVIENEVTIYKDNQIETVLSDAAIWLNDEEYGTENDEQIGVIEIESVRRYDKAKELLSETLETVEELFLTDKFRFASLDKSKNVIEQAAKAIMAANKDLHMTACKTNKDYKEESIFDNLSRITNVIKSTRKKDYFYNYLESIFNGKIQVSIADALNLVVAMKTFMVS